MFKFQRNAVIASLLFGISWVANAMPTYSIEAVSRAPFQLSQDAIASAQYKVTNNERTARILTLARVPGLLTKVSGVGACQDPFILGPGESCLLGLELIASQLGGGIHDGPVVCKARGFSNIPDLNSCSRPLPNDSLQVAVVPCTTTTCLNFALSEQLRAIAKRYERQFGIPGLVAGVWIPGQGQLIIEDGVADINTNRFISASDHFRIGSITKSFTVTVILKLIEESILSFTTPVNVYLPTVENGTATIAQLANMRSGIFNYSEDAALAQELAANLLRKWLPQELVDAADSNLPYFPPDSNWHYSNTNTVILGMIIQQVTGNFVGNEIFNRILQPLALNQTSYPLTAAMPEPFARGYAAPPPYEDVTLVDPSFPAAAGAMVSTLADLKIWAEALGQGRLLSPAMFGQQLNSLMPIVFAPCPDDDPLRPKTICPEYDRYGYGMGQLRGWLGHTADYFGYQALMMYQPVSGAVVVILINLSGTGTHIPTDMFLEFAALLN
ncbi:D-alanyl-D-alanine carboxypeptidase precursor [Legionella massiliensis]|uniref:D-alanyl-D-alanine carboxypeptidase n=1 Tax=Legionella massiliensis TaxID=1034943 RepID=A0A078KWM2_9GAMM|nr:serine hydrolase domain-containing protein [Legionella massiliensis]CDZ78860.1 D-alanyl-D-alanine carboxypeptidase precursor [Legionella massiliensis]CEE14598.1 D-alanyl-D-alanine carboxypeptidase precursor [Legionella massiliensis]